MLLDHATIYGFKSLRAVSLGVALDVSQKYASSRFMMAVYARGKKAPDLFPVATTAMAIENAVFWFALTLVYLVVGELGRGAYGDRFFLDLPNVVLPLLFDYACCNVVILSIAYIVSRIMQNPGTLRYQDDGMRGIRAYAQFVWLLSLATLAMPFYLVVA